MCGFGSKRGDKSPVTQDVMNHVCKYSSGFHANSDIRESSTRFIPSFYSASGHLDDLAPNRQFLMLASNGRPPAERPRLARGPGHLASDGSDRWNKKKNKPVMALLVCLSPLDRNCSSHRMQCMHMADSGTDGRFGCQSIFKCRPVPPPCATSPTGRDRLCLGSRDMKVPRDVRSSHGVYNNC